MSDDEVMHPAQVLVEAARAMYESNMGAVRAMGAPVPEGADAATAIAALLEHVAGLADAAGAAAYARVARWYAAGRPVDRDWATRLAQGVADLPTQDVGPGLRSSYLAAGLPGWEG